MHKVFLSTTLPETTVISPKVAPDIHMKLHEYHDEQNIYRNETPKIRPHLLEKYDVQKDEKPTLSAEEREQNIKETFRPIEQPPDDDYVKAVDALPQNHQARGRKLVPFLKRINLEGEEVEDVLYDLIVKKAKKQRTSEESFRSIIRQMDRLHDLPSSYYHRRAVASPTVLQARSAKREIDGTPQTRAIKRIKEAETPTYFTPQKTEPAAWF